MRRTWTWTGPKGPRSKPGTTGPIRTADQARDQWTKLRTRTRTRTIGTIVDHRLFGPRTWTNSADHRDHRDQDQDYRDLRGSSSLRTSDLDQLGGPSGPSWTIVSSDRGLHLDQCGPNKDRTPQLDQRGPNKERGPHLDQCGPIKDRGPHLDQCGP